MDKPVIVNGMTYTNQAELDKRIEEDTIAMAQLLYDIYEDHKGRENRLSAN